MRYIILFAKFLWVPFVLFPILASAQTFEGLAFNSELEVHDDASVTVAETIGFRVSGGWLGWVERVLPKKVCDPEANLYSFQYVFNGAKLDGKEARAEVVPQEDYFRIRVRPVEGDIKGGDHSLELGVTIRPYHSPYAEFTKFFWPVNGDGWRTGFENVSASLLLPGAVPKADVSGTSLVGGKGNLQMVTGGKMPDKTLYFSSKGPMPAEQGLWIEASWPRGYVEDVAAPEDAGFGKCRAGFAQPANPHERKSIESLIAILRDDAKPLKERYEAAQQLGTRGAAALPAVPLAIELFNELDRGLRGSGFLVLSGVGEKSMPALLEAFDNKKIENQAMAFQTFLFFGRKAHSAIPYIIEGIKDADLETHFEAIRALGRVGYGDKRAVKALQDLLSRKEDAYQAAVALGSFRDPEMIPIFLGMIRNKDQDEVFRAAGCGALLEYGAIQMPAGDIVEAVNDPDHSLASHCAPILGNLRAKEAVHALIAASKRPSVFLETAAIGALYKIGTPEALAAVEVYRREKLPILIQRLQTGGHDERCSTAGAMGSLGRAVKDALPALAQCLKDKVPGLFENCAYAMAVAQDDATEFVPDLINVLDVPTPTMTVEIALAYIGTDAALAALRDKGAENIRGLMSRVAAGGQPRVAIPALEAIRKIGGTGADDALERFSNPDNAEELLF